MVILLRRCYGFISKTSSNMCNYLSSQISKFKNNWTKSSFGLGWKFQPYDGILTWTNEIMHKRIFINSFWSLRRKCFSAYLSFSRVSFSRSLFILFCCNVRFSRTSSWVSKSIMFKMANLIKRFPRWSKTK